MSPGEARHVLELLARGVDPETGAPLPLSGPLRSPTVSRALLLGAMALRGAAGQHQAGGKSSASSHAGRAWRLEEEERLLSAFDAGTPIEQIARDLDRSMGGIAARLVRLGRIAERAEAYARDRRMGDRTASGNGVK